MDFILKPFETHLTVTRIANIHYFEFSNDYHTKSDQHAFCELVFVDSGEIYITADNYSGPLKKGQAIIHMPMEKHDFKCMDIEAPNIIIIGFECNAKELEALSKAPIDINSEQQKRLTETIKEGRNVFLPPYDLPYVKDMKKRKEFPFGADQLIKINLEALLISLIRSYNLKNTNSNATIADYKINEICKYIEENFCENITLDDLCFIFSTNKTSLCNSFKKSMNMSVIEYINKLKYKKSKQMLREGKKNITQISSDLGFSSVHYFCRFFKKYAKLSPSQYAKTIKSKLDM